MTATHTTQFDPFELEWMDDQGMHDLEGVELAPRELEDEGGDDEIARASEELRADEG